MIRKRGRPKGSNNQLKRSLAKQYLRENPDATNFEVKQHARCGDRIVAMARAELRAVGLAIMSPSDKITQRRAAIENAMTAEAIVKSDTIKESDSPEVLPLKSAAELTEEIERQAGTNLDDITLIEMKRVLTRIIKNPGQPANVRIAAIAQKQKLDFETQDRNALGPGPPMSRAEGVKRLAHLIYACGPDMLHDAITLAFGGTYVTKEAVDNSKSGITPTETTPNTESEAGISPSP